VTCVFLVDLLDNQGTPVPLEKQLNIGGLLDRSLVVIPDDLGLRLTHNHAVQPHGLALENGDILEGQVDGWLDGLYVAGHLGIGGLVGQATLHYHVATGIGLAS